MSQGPTNSDLPPSMVQGLHDAFRTPIQLDPRVDAAIAGFAHDRAIAIRRGARRRRALKWGVAAAAGLALGAFLMVRTVWAPSHPAMALAEDVNGDGSVDILDAFALERAIAGAGTRLVDVNGDGAVNRLDVDRIAIRAVRLGEGGNG